MIASILCCCCCYMLCLLFCVKIECQIDWRQLENYICDEMRNMFYYLKCACVCVFSSPSYMLLNELGQERHSCIHISIYSSIRIHIIYSDQKNMTYVLFGQYFDVTQSIDLSMIVRTALHFLPICIYIIVMHTTLQMTQCDIYVQVKCSGKQVYEYRMVNAQKSSCVHHRMIDRSCGSFLLFYAITTSS